MKTKLLFALIILSSVIVYAASFSDITQSDFNNGTYENTSYNGVGVILSGTNTSGTYTSKIFDATSAARWDNLTLNYNLTTKEHLYAVDDDADVWNSNNSGVNWSLVKDDYNGASANAADTGFSNRGSLYAVSNQQIWGSADTGVTWTKINDDYNGAEGQNAFASSADKNNNFFIIEGGQDVWKSIDSGVTWTKTAAAFSSKGVAGLVVNSSNILITVDNGADVWKSIDSGVTWTKINDDYNGAEGNSATAITIDSNNVLYILDSTSVWKSIDSGVTWTKQTSDFDTADAHVGISMSTDSENKVYVIDSSEDNYISADGASWTKQSVNFNGANSNAKVFTAILKTTNITFQVRNCSSVDCSDGTWQTTNLNNIHLTGRYFQYQATFSSQDSSISPKLYNVSLDYTILDNTSPSFSNYAENPASSSDYVSGQNYKFNATITDNTALGSVWIEFNNVNYTNGNIANVSNNYSFTRTDLAAGTYSYKWWANDSYGNLNNSEIRYYTISKANGDNIVHLATPSAGWSYNYGTSAIFSCSADYGTPKLYKNNIEILNPSTLILGVGTYAIKCNVTESQNYTAGIAQGSLTVNKAASQTSLTFDKNSPQTYGTAITPACSFITGAGNLLLTNGTSGIAETLDAGIWNFNCSYAGNENYTQSSNFSQFVINKASQTAILSINETSPLTYGTEINVTCNGDLYRNNNLINSEKSQSVLLGAGSYGYSCQLAENENYSYDDDNLTFIMNKANGDISLKLNNQENNVTIDYPETYNLNATTLYGSVAIYKDGVEITGVNDLDLTPTRNAALYNITAISSGDENHSETWITRWLSVTLDITAPVLSIISPQEGASYGYNESLPLDFSVSDSEGHLDSCWYDVNNGENVTLINCGNTTFNINLDGSYTLYLYANDTLGNEANTNAEFSVQVGSPTITLSSPIGIYLNSNNVVFRYVPSDTDLASCELWGDFAGNFSLNQTDSAPLNNAENRFNLILLDGIYKWNVRCVDSVGHSSFNGNKTFYVDTIAPQIVLTEPKGTKSSRTNIPISFSNNDSSPVTCLYNVYRGLNLEIANTSINCNNANSFNLTLDADFVFNLYLIDYAGNSNFSSSSFTISTSSSTTPPSSGGGGGGGGGGGSVGNATKKQTSKIEIDSISDMIVNPGESKKITLKLKNTGTSFLNGCKLQGTGENSGWISGTETIGLSAGEIKESLFDLNVPDKINSGKYKIEISVNCEETSQGISFIAEIIEKKLGIELIDVKRDGKDKLKVIYSLSELSNQEQNIDVDIIIFDSGGQKLAEIKETKNVQANSKSQFESILNIPENIGNSISLLINANSGVASTFLQEEVILGASGVSGMAIFSRIGENSGAISIILVIIFALIAFFVFRRILRFKKMAGLHKVKEVNYVKLSEHHKKSEK